MLRGGNADPCGRSGATEEYERASSGLNQYQGGKENTINLFKTKVRACMKV